MLVLYFITSQKKNNSMKKIFAKDLLEYYNVLKKTKNDIFINDVLDYIWHNKLISENEYGMLTGCVSMTMKNSEDITASCCPFCRK